jgi:hypothetical protein
MYKIKRDVVGKVPRVLIIIAASCDISPPITGDFFFSVRHHD